MKQVEMVSSVKLALLSCPARVNFEMIEKINISAFPDLAYAQWRLNEIWIRFYDS